MAILAIGVALNACKKDEDDVKKKPDNEEEVITTMSLLMQDSAGVEILKVFSFRDIDGEGGNGPVQFDTVRLSPNTIYYTSILLLNETETPPDTISNEVAEEADEHLFCFEPNGAEVDIERTDSDGVYEVGLESTWRTGKMSNGTVRISLKHQPDVKDGSCAPGETDIEVDFITEIQ